MYVRVDEVLVALAFCAKQVQSEPLRALANSEAIAMITNQDNFLLFVHYYIKLTDVLRGGAGHKHFAHGMSRVVEQWYGKHSPVDLANMFGEHRGMHRLRHQSVIKKAHMRTKKQNAAAAAGAEVNASNGAAATGVQQANANATGGVNNGASTSATVSPSNVQSTTTAAAAVESSALSIDDDREQVLTFVFCNSSQEYLQYLEEIPELGAGAQRLQALQKLKTNENVDGAVEQIKRHQFTFDQMPAHLLEQEKVWDALLPKFTTPLLLHHFHTMKDRGFLNDESAFSRKFLNIFGKPEPNSKNLCPIHVYIQKVLYMQNMRYASAKKSEYYKKKMDKRKVTTNPLIMKRLDEIFEQSLKNAPAAPARFFITLDLRRGNAKSKCLFLGYVIRS